ncbi:MAG: hypothetical protein JNK49_18450 [Planctomycetes bacterium]|nr:hypothetical protein [Planctomycetota bacterium]
MPRSALALAQQEANRFGLNLFGVVDTERFDACQPPDQRIRSRWPGCGTVVVLGSGGREFWQRFAQACRDAGAQKTLPAPGPQQFASQCVQHVAGCFHRAAVRVGVVEPTGPCPSLLRLAEAAGFGTVSPVNGLLVHPHYGPWVSLRAALLFEGRPFGPVADAAVTDRFQPCCSCKQPCRTACTEPECAADGSGCRCRCPVGSEHRVPVPEARQGAVPPGRCGQTVWIRPLWPVVQIVQRFWRR